jgi:hypothetical protein
MTCFVYPEMMVAVCKARAEGNIKGAHGAGQFRITKTSLKTG